MPAPVFPGKSPTKGFDTKARVKDKITKTTTSTSAASTTSGPGWSKIIDQVQKLGSGSTAKGKLKGGELENPVFHPSMTERFIPGVGTSQSITHGYIIQKEGWGTGPGGGRYKLRFLFNPNDFTVEYLQQGDVFAQPQQAVADNVANSTIPNMQTMNINLLFDRTMEVAVVGGALARPNDTYDNRWNKGCYADVEIMEKIVGIKDGFGGVQKVPVDIYFGDLAMFKSYAPGSYGKQVTASEGKPLKFSGNLTGMSVTYTHFSHTMTPVRCTIAVGWTQALYTAAGNLATPDGEAGEGSLTGAGTDAGADVGP